MAKCYPLFTAFLRANSHAAQLYEPVGAANLPPDSILFHLNDAAGLVVKQPEPLLIAASRPDTRNLAEAIKKTKVESRSSLFCASWDSDYPTIQTLVKLGADVNMQTDGTTCLHTLCSRTGGNDYLSAHWTDLQIEQITEFLVKSGANINAVNYTTGSTPLMNAIWSRYIRTALKLIELGADTTIVNHEGLTALELAKKDDISHCANATRSAAEVIKAIEAHIKKRK